MTAFFLGAGAVAASGGGGGDTVSSILGATMQLWHRGDNVQATGAPSGGLRWTDLSGNGRHSDAPSVSASPSTATELLPGHPALTSDGTDDVLVNVAAASVWQPLHDGTTRGTVWIVADMLAAANKYGVVGTAPGGASEIGVTYSFEATQGLRSNFPFQNGSGTLYLQAVAGSATSVAPAVNRFDHLGPEQIARALAWSATETYTAEDTTPTGSPSTADPSYTLYLFRRPGTTQFHNIRIAELIVAFGATPTQVADVDTLLRNNYGTL